MTATEPELTVAEVTLNESHAAPASWVGLVGQALLGAWLGVLVSVALSLWLLEGSYAGASDDAAAAVAIATYQPFLEAIAWQFAWLGVVQALCLTPVVLGLLLLVRAHPRSASWTHGAPRGLLPAMFGLLAVFAFFVSEAHRHPGLFLSLLSGSFVLTTGTRLGPVLALVVFGGAALGYVFTGLHSRGRRSVQLVCGAVLLLPPLLWLGGSLLPKPSRVFGQSGEVVAQPPSQKSSPNVLLLAVDSLRPDMIDPVHTPHLSKLLAESVYFPNTLVTQPRTGPSWSATLTSLPPLRNGVETMFPSSSLSQLETFALPAHLAQLGYRTAVFSEYAGEFFTRANFGFQIAAVPSVELKDIAGQMLMMRVPSLLAATSLLYTQGPLGRQLLDQRLNNLMRGMANFAYPEVLLDDMLALARVDRPAPPAVAAPFFWLVFYSQPHFPYTSSSDFYPEYQVSGASSELRFGRDAVNETPITTPEDREQLVGLYRAALAETDAAIGKLLTRLEAEHQLDETIIVLLADHGEGLYDCPSCVGHGDNLKSLVTLRVPLAFRLPPALYPQAKPGQHEGYVSQLDVYPTLLALLGQKRMAHHEGLALLNDQGVVQPMLVRTLFAESGEWLWPTAAVPTDRIAYPVITEMAKLEGGRIVIDSKYTPEIRAAKHRTVIRAPYKLDYEPGASQVQYHLYQFEQDPFETEDLISSQPEVAEELKRALFRSMLRHPQVLELAGYFLTRPDPPPAESW